MKRLYTFTFVLITHLSFGQAITLTPRPAEGGGVILATGVYLNPIVSPPSPNVPAGGQGTRLMWIPSLSAFRAGTVRTNQWDLNNVGAFSTATGFSTIASGYTSTAMGYDTRASGESSIATGVNTTASGTTSTAMGFGTISSGGYSTALGYSTRATQTYSTAMGNQTVAGGEYSTAIGVSTQAIGLSSTAMGYASMANGDYSTAIGSGTIAGGNRSTAMGYVTSAKAFGSTAIGIQNNVTGYFPDGNQPDPINRIFEIGNGTILPAVYSNALTIYQNARTVINDVNVTDAMFRIKHNSSTNDSHVVLYEDSNDFGRLTFKNGITDNFWTVAAYPQPTAAASIFNLFFSGTGVNAMSLTGNGNTTFLGCVTASNLTCPSDIRYKKNIQPLSNSLQNIQKMQGVRYDWKREEFAEKNFSQESQIGFIAQEIETVFPEMVLTDEKGYKSVDYARITPVLVEAIKELNQKNKNLESRLDKIEALLSVRNENVSTGK